MPVKEQSESHHELILGSELDLKILKTHLGVILFHIRLIISIYCRLPSTETFMLFSGSPGLRTVADIIVALKFRILYLNFTDNLRGFSLKNEACAL